MIDGWAVPPVGDDVYEQESNCNVPSLGANDVPKTKNSGKC